MEECGGFGVVVVRGEASGWFARVVADWDVVGGACAVCSGSGDEVLRRFKGGSLASMVGRL